MPQQSGIEAAIRELEAEQKKLSEAISLLRRVRPGGANHATRRRRLSAAARRRISEAAKKRWAAILTKKGRAAKA